MTIFAPVLLTYYKFNITKFSYVTCNLTAHVKILSLVEMRDCVRQYTSLSRGNQTFCIFLAEGFDNSLVQMPSLDKNWAIDNLRTDRSYSG